MLFLLFFACSTPLRITYNSFSIGVSQLAAYAFILWRAIAGGIKQEKAEQNARWLIRGISALALLAGILFLLSSNWDMRRSMALDWLAAGLVFLCLLRSPIADWKRMAWLFVLAALPNVILGGLQHIAGIGLAPKDFSGWGADASGSPVFGLFQHSNDLAVFLYWPFLAVIGLAYACRGWKRIASIVLAAFFGLIIYWTISRSILITLLLLVVLFLLVSLLPQRKWFARVCAAACAIGCLGFVWIAATHSTAEINTILSGRLDLWNRTASLIGQDKLLLPLGYIELPPENTQIYWIPHNIYLLFWILYGWLGPILLAGAGILLLRAGWIRYEQLRSQKPAVILWLGIAGIFLIDGMVSLYFHEAYFILNAVCIIAIWMLQITSIDSEPGAASTSAAG
ncbi:MAG: O-antigen ligase family protein [Anaerolineales bacterium]